MANKHVSRPERLVMKKSLYARTSGSGWRIEDMSLISSMQITRVRMGLTEFMREATSSYKLLRTRSLSFSSLTFASAASRLLLVFSK